MLGPALGKEKRSVGSSEFGSVRLDAKKSGGKGEWGQIFFGLVCWVFCLVVGSMERLWRGEYLRWVEGGDSELYCGEKGPRRWEKKDGVM